MTHLSSSQAQHFHCFPPTGAEERNLDGACEGGSPPHSHRQKATGPTSVYLWANSPLVSPTHHPALPTTRSPNPAPVVLAEIFVAAPLPGSPTLGDSLPATPRPPCHSLSPCSTQHCERGVAFFFSEGHSRLPLPRSCTPPPHASLLADSPPGRGRGARSHGPAHRPGHPRLPRRRTR